MNENIFREVKKEDLNLQKTFSPIRELLLLNDEKWSEFTNDNSLSTLGAVEVLFSLNEIYPQGLNGAFKQELGLFLGQMDTFQVTLSFIASITKEQRVSSILNEIRMAIQNFTVFLDIKSFYSAFQSFRKILEGVLWVNFIKDDLTNIPEIITTREYSKKLSEISPVLGEAYSLFNNLFHFSPKTPMININVVYKTSDGVYEMLEKISECADIITANFSKLLINIDNTSIKRYIVLLDKLSASRETYNLRNFNITTTGNSILPNEKQLVFEEILKSKKSIYAISSFLSNYSIGLNELSNMQMTMPKYTQKTSDTLKYLSRYSTSLIMYIPAMDHRNMNLNAEFTQLNRPSGHKTKVSAICKNMAELLLSYELKNNGNIDAAFLKSIFEDIVANEGIWKSHNFELLTLIKDFINVKYGEKFEKNDNGKYSHIIINGRLAYSKDILADEQLTYQGLIRSEYFMEIKKVTEKINELITDKRI